MTDTDWNEWSGMHREIAQQVITERTMHACDVLDRAARKPIGFHPREQVTPTTNSSQRVTMKP